MRSRCILRHTTPFSPTPHKRPGDEATEYTEQRVPRLQQRRDRRVAQSTEQREAMQARVDEHYS